MYEWRSYSDIISYWTNHFWENLMFYVSYK